MAIHEAYDVDAIADRLADLLREHDLVAAEHMVVEMPAPILVDVLQREDHQDRAIIYRLLPRDTALEVFERFEPSMRADLIEGLREEEVVGVFETMDPDDRVSLIDELPASVAARLMGGLSSHERELTAPMLGYPAESIGRHMSTEYIRVGPDTTAAEVIQAVHDHGEEAETVYLIMVVGSRRELLGVVGLREVLLASDDTPVSELMVDPEFAMASEDAETAARRATKTNHLVTPVTDAQGRLIGVLTIDDAARIVDRADLEDSSRAGAVEPLDMPYLATSVNQIFRSRVVWLLVLALSAILTVQVLDMFEDALATVVTLSLFIPLLTGTAGNTGAQAATTVTRALAVGEVRLRDTWKVAWREVRVGSLLGVMLGVIGLVLAGLIFGFDFGLIIGLTLVSICTIAATVGGLMPMLAKLIRADPAVFSTPFISTFCDASGLIVYFLIATTILGI